MNEERRILGYEFRTTCFSDLMRLNINMYTSLDQDSPELQINHPQNTGEINSFKNNWRHYEGLQLLDEQNEIRISRIVEKNQMKLMMKLNPINSIYLI